jgi:hypothetical protein
VVRRPPGFPSLRLEGWRFQVWVGGGGNAGAEEGNWQVVCSVHLSELREAAREGGLMLLAAVLCFCVRAPHWHLGIPGCHGLAVDGEVPRRLRRPNRGQRQQRFIAVFLRTATVGRYRRYGSQVDLFKGGRQRRSVVRESLPRPTQPWKSCCSWAVSDDENKRTCCCFGWLCVSVAWVAKKKKTPRAGRQSSGRDSGQRSIAVATTLAGGDTRSRQVSDPLALVPTGAAPRRLP